MAEYIDKQRAKDLMGCCLASAKAEYKAAKGYFEKARFGDYISSIQAMIDVVGAVEAADVQPVNQWISVDDKLPEWDKTVLVWYASDTLFGVSEGYGLSWYHGSWRLNELNGENIRIFYWQYLPEKPKEG